MMLYLGQMEKQGPIAACVSLNRSAAATVDDCQGWTGNRAYRAFSRWADALKGPTEVFFLPSRRDSEQPVADWFVSCIDRVNHPITMRYRRSDEVFCSAYTKIAGRRRRGEQLNR